MTRLIGQYLGTAPKYLKSGTHHDRIANHSSDPEPASEMQKPDENCSPAIAGSISRSAVEVAGGAWLGVPYFLPGKQTKSTQPER